MSGRAKSSLAVVLFIALLIAFVQTITSPIVIDAQDGIASIHLVIKSPVWIGNCVAVDWDVEHISAVYLNDSGRIGSASDTSCAGLPTLKVQLTDGVLHIFGPDEILAVRYKGILELIAALLLLATWKKGMATFVLIGSFAVSSILIPREIVTQAVPLINDGFNSALAMFSLADKFSVFFPFACLVTVLYWVVIPVGSRHCFLLAAGLLALFILGASLEFVLLVVVLVLAAYISSAQKHSPPARSNDNGFRQSAPVFYLLLVELVLLISAIWGSIWTNLANPVVVATLFLFTLPIWAFTVRKLPILTAFPVVFLAAGIVVCAIPQTSLYAPILGLLYFGTLTFIAIRTLEQGIAPLYRRVIAYTTIAAILLAFIVGKWPVLHTDLLGWIGFSYLAFRLLHVLLDGLNNRSTDASLLEMLIYALFYPALLVGPIDRLPRFLKDLRVRDRRFEWKFVIVGVTRIAIGVAKKFFVADILLAPLALGISLPLPYNTPNAWSQVFAYSLYIFFDFSGYIDIVLGIGYLLGFSLPENFDSPYIQLNITRFWQAWHITLSNWLRTYIFLPLSGRLLRSRLRRHPTVVVFIGQMTTMLLIGLWHGVTMNFVMWGLWHGVGLFLHKIYSDKTKPYIHRLADYPALHRIYTFGGLAFTFTFVSLGWVFFALPNLAASAQVFRTLFNVR